VEVEPGHFAECLYDIDFETGSETEVAAQTT
jgi:hypothetical protein